MEERRKRRLSVWEEAEKGREEMGKSETEVEAEREGEKESGRIR